MFALTMISLPIFCFATDVLEEEVTPRIRKIYLEPERSIWEKGEIKFLLAVSGGYDNNTHLDSQRDADVYMQTFLKSTYASPVSKKTDLVMDYTIMSLLYADESNLDLITNYIHAGLDHKLNEKFIFSTGYGLDIIENINSGLDDYTENAIDAKLKQKLANKMYQSLGYILAYRMYSRRYTRLATAEETTKKRNDLRNTLEYEIGKFLSKDLIKLTVQYYNNNSNDPYLHYYDYDSWRIGASLTHIFDDKVSGYLSVSRQYRDYRNRTLIYDPGIKENDTTYLLTSALYYNVNKSLALGLSYTYRKNSSNEPIERYSGSLISVSTYYRF
jgi:hypothetical protein